MDRSKKINRNIKLWQAILKNRMWRKKIKEGPRITDTLKIEEISK